MLVEARREDTPEAGARRGSLVEDALADAHDMLVVHGGHEDDVAGRSDQDLGVVRHADGAMPHVDAAVPAHGRL